MTDKELVKQLIADGAIDEQSASRALKGAEYSGRSVEEILYERRIGDEVAIAKTKAKITGAPYKKIDPNKITDDLLKIIPQETAVNYKVVPLEKKSGMLVVGMLRPDDARAQEALKFIAKQNSVSLGVYVITPSDLALALRKYLPYKNEIAEAVKEIGNIGEKEKSIKLEEGWSEQDAPVIKIVASTLRQAVQVGASDVHIEPEKSKIRIRFRLDGNLKEVVSLPESLAHPVISRVKVLSRLKLDENRIPQDGRFRSFLFGRDIDFRVSTFPTPNGEKVAIRVLDPTKGLKGLEGLGFNKYSVDILEKAIARPYGMILISGPTGSGKTTTLYAVTQKLNKENVNIVTLEDPVEYFMDGVNQSQVRPEIGYTFASGLRQILRQDPDIIMVGEIRDIETAGLAINAALTGHIVLSTIHTNNALGVIPRLLDLEVPKFLIPSALNLMLAQRLVLKLCPDCREKVVASKEEEKIIEKELRELPEMVKKDISYSSPYTLYKAGKKPDCKKCGGKGIIGRLAIVEIFRMTHELAGIITEGFTENKLIEEAKRQNMVGIRQDGVLKALEGEISFAEVIRETEEK